jgi:hypothetical protein
VAGVSVADEEPELMAGVVEVPVHLPLRLVAGRRHGSVAARSVLSTHDLRRAGSADGLIMRNHITP